MRGAIARRAHGFTLIELMIVIAIIGVLASIAIPSFRNYQMNAKRAEAYANLAALAKAQKTYFAEFNQFVLVLQEPGTTDVSSPTGVKRPVGSVTSAFSAVGWTPEGDVYFDYDTAAPGHPACSLCTDGCFTASAYGNLDEDLSISEFVYFHANAAGQFCFVGNSGKGPPQDPVTTNIMWDQAVHHPNSDRF